MTALRALAILVALSASPAAAQDLGGAKAFVTGLYTAYARHPGPDYLGRQARQVFSPALLELMRRDAARTPKGDVGTLDGDPICNCQDYEITSVEVARIDSPFLGLDSMVCFIEDTAERWRAHPAAKTAEVEVSR